MNGSTLSGNELFDLGTHNLKTGQSALLRFLWSTVENVWIQFLGAGLKMALELPQVCWDATRGGWDMAGGATTQASACHLLFGNAAIVWNLAQGAYVLDAE